MSILFGSNPNKRQNVSQSFTQFIPPPTSDDYFEYTTLLLPGNGTNGAQNNTFLDGSTNNFTITRNGNSTQGTFSPFSPTGWSYYFDGAGDTITAPSNAAFAPGTGDFTLEFWTYPTVDSSQRCIFDTRGSNSDGSGMFFRTDSTNAYLFGRASSTILYVTGRVNNVWQHVALVRSSGVVTIYIDGVSQGSTANTTNFTTTNCRISGFVDTTASPYAWLGYLSNLRFVKGTAVYTSNFTPPTSALAAITNTSLLTLQSNRLVDNSPNAFTLSRGGEISTQAFSPFTPTSSWSATTNGGSGYFDGSGDYLSIADSTAFDLPGDFTIEFWAYPLNVSTSPNFVTLGSSSGSNNGFLIYYSAGSSSLRFYSNGVSVAAGPTLINNQWYHVAVVRSGSGSNNLAMYVNGVLVTTVTNTTSFTGIAGNGFCVGAEYSTGYNVLGQQYISSIRLVKGTAVYTGAFTPPIAPLSTSGAASASAYSSTTNVNTSFASSETSLLLTFTNAGIYDATSKNDLETVGNAQISTTQSKFGGSSMYFDGTGDYLIGPANNFYNFGTSDFTIECWVRFNSVGSTQMFVTSNYNSTTGAGGWLFAYRQDNTTLKFGCNSNVSYEKTWSPSVNIWYHVAASRSGSSLRLFVDGTQIGTTSTSTDNISGASTIVVAGNLGGAPNFVLNGYLQDLRITNYARYTANFTPPTAAFPIQ